MRCRGLLTRAPTLIEGLGFRLKCRGLSSSFWYEAPQVLFLEDLFFRYAQIAQNLAGGSAGDRRRAGRSWNAAGEFSEVIMSIRPILMPQGLLDIRGAWVTSRSRPVMLAAFVAIDQSFQRKIKRWQIANW